MVEFASAFSSITLDNHRKCTQNNKTLKYLFSTLNEYVEWYSNGAEGKPKAHTASIMNYDDVTIEHISSQATASPLEAFSGDNMHKFYNLTLLTRSDCQAKCNTFFKKSLGDKNPRHLRGRLLIRETTASNCSCVTLLKSVPLGKKKRTNPFMFSLLPRCQGA